MGRYQTYEWNRATRPKLNRTARKKLAQFLHETVSEKELQIPLPKKQPTKEPRFYEADDKPKAKRPQVPRTEGKPKLRKSITPGTVLILVAGPYRGKRVVFLKQLPNGSLVVTGMWVRIVVLSLVRSFFSQWCSSETCCPGLCDCDFDQDRYLWSQGR
jgi:hypothetical protein